MGQLFGVGGQPIPMVPGDDTPVVQPLNCRLPEMVDHPAHYGGKDNPYEAIKVIENWHLGFNLGCVAKYVSRCGKKSIIHRTTSRAEDLQKAGWYLLREVAIAEGMDPDYYNDAVLVARRRTKE